MLAQDFLRMIALETVGAGVPAADVAARVEHVDRVVADPGDQVLVTPFVAQGRPGLHVMLQGRSAVCSDQNVCPNPLNDTRTPECLLRPRPLDFTFLRDLARAR